METYKEQLIKLLKTCDNVKEAMEKLEFGCKIEYYFDTGDEYNPTEINTGILLNNRDFFNFLDKEIYDGRELEIKKIIGIPLQERFIRIYCENTKKLRIDFLHEFLQISNVFSKEKSSLIEMDITKDFDNQEDIVYQKIYEALLSFNK